MAENEYKAAVETKQVIEAEIEAIVAELSSGNNPGIDGPLVDTEGFPRADIDVYRVRQLRHQLALKQTDHRIVMNEIEKLLPRVFEARSGNKQQQIKTAGIDLTDSMKKLETEWKVTLNQVKQEEEDLLSFAVVESVQRGSPADIAGLQAQDELLRFGSADASNHRELAAIKDIVQRNINRQIRVLVRRKSEVLVVELTPQAWQGSGVLGCLLQPM
ncbi:putative PDZ domain, 26S Proteasome non-ATPase regulatory subunit 9, PDZ superfamily, PDZ domain 6 [Plasmopara halstedii]